MSNYSLGKIYSLFCNKTGKKYIGSTTETLLCKRLAGHKSAYKRYLLGKGSYTTSFEILKEEDFYITLLEAVICNTKDELLMKEREWILKLDCVNKVIPMRTPSEYYHDNIEIITAKKSLKIFCGCGSWYRTDNKVHHYATAKHENWLILCDLFEKQIIVEEDKEKVYDELKDLEIDLDTLIPECDEHIQNGQLYCELCFKK